MQVFYLPIVLLRNDLFILKGCKIMFRASALQIAIYRLKPETKYCNNEIRDSKSGNPLIGKES